MVLETWLIKFKKTISTTLDSKKQKSHVGVLAFELAGLMSKLLQLWQSLSDESVTRLRSENVCLEGVRKIVSNDDAFLLGLACAEFVENLRLIAKAVSRFSSKCESSTLRCFARVFDDFADTGRDPNEWLLLGSKDVESKMKKVDQFVSLTVALHREMDELVVLENGLKKALRRDRDHYGDTVKESKIMEMQQKILWQRQEVKYLKEKSLWCRSFDTVTLLLARSIFTVLARIKLVFGINHALPRSLSASSSVHPSEDLSTSKNGGFFELNSEILRNPPSSTLGSAALALHYANLVIVMEKMIKSPQLVGVDARDDLYAMLPNNIRYALRARLRGVGFSASDPVLATEWKEALQRILAWLLPLAQNMIKWQNERSFEQHKIVPRTNVLLLQTFFFANQEKTEAAITELLVGLNYIWRFEREMNAKAFFQCTNFNGFMSSQVYS